MNPNHPKKGSKIRTEPIKSIEDIQKVKKHLVKNPRNYAIFTLGINTNLRASDIIGLNIEDISEMTPGDILNNKDKKIQRYQQRSLNKAVIDAIKIWLHHHPDKSNPKAPLFTSQRGNRLTVPAMSRMVKSWCNNAKISKGHYASHSLRKTFAYHAINTFKEQFHLVSAALGHRDHKTTLAYLGIQDKEIKEVFMNEL